jgi:two-component system, chemotaxis family, CheB/CheR fusion protein
MTPKNGKKSKEQSKRQPVDGSSARSSSRAAQFLVAAIGASAGGIEAFTEFLRNLSTDTGMAFVFVQHLDPKHHSILTELLSKESKMPVREVTNGMKLEPNNVYVIPPNASMSVADHSLRLRPREDAPRGHMPIDQFMRSLAEQLGSRAIGVILSGSGSDGTLGLAEIQAQGGVTFAQEEATAKYESMPHSAIAAGCVDYVLPPKRIASELGRISRHPYVVPPAGSRDLLTASEISLNSIFQLLRRTTGVDFTHYRQTTILRRIQRRMVVHKLDKLEDYVRYVQTNPAEIKALYQDMLINVTSFFRNPAVFDAMRSEVFPKILKLRLQEAPIRIWTPGCASGEETYSVAIALLETLGDKAAQTPIQMFGTDVSETSIAKARAGVYPENIQGDVAPERLRRFFTRTEGGYRISKSIRDMCIFAQHNVLNDPPFSQMDVICCRNLLIYLEPVLQSKVISLFHYAAKPDGFLVLGTSEGIGSVGNLFATEDRAFKIFSKKASAARQTVTFSLNRQSERNEFGPVRIPTKSADSSLNYLEAQKEFDRRLLSQYAPSAVFVNEDLEIVHTRGNVNRYLKLAPGRASLSVVKMAREGLLFDLRNAIARAKKENTSVSKHNVQIKVGNGNGNGNGNGHSKSASPPHKGDENIRFVNFDVVPLKIGNSKDLYFMILFTELPHLSSPASTPRTGKRREQETQRETSRISKLEDELGATKEYLQSVIETQEATNEELQSANEEILSSNEELQSTNEELETAKEELQSANEELSTVNDELRSRNIEITQVNNDLTNLLSSIDIAVVMVGSDLTIRRFTPRAEKIMGLIAGDIGRPFLNINPTLEIADFQQLVLQVISTFRPTEKEFSDRHGSRFLLRVLPYRTSEGKIDGAVITLVDVPRK